MTVTRGLSMQNGSQSPPVPPPLSPMTGVACGFAAAGRVSRR